MILKRSQITGFGKLRDLTLDYQRGLNLIFAPNEGGKSTLQRFLLALLYGQLRSDLKVQRRLDPWVEQFKPWHGSEYGGILWCRLADERELEIHRGFGKEENRIEIRTSAGEDVTAQYEKQRNGDVLFARYHFGMPKTLYESVGVIRENRVSEIQGYETIRDRIANLAQSGDEELSVRQSLDKLREKLDSIGSERAPTKPYRQAMDVLEDLQNERTAAEERRKQFQNWIEERNRLAGETSELESDLSKAQSSLISARVREISSRVQSLEEVDASLRSLRNEIELLGARVDFPTKRLEELNRLVNARDSVSGRLSEVRSEKESALELLDRAESERQKLESYEELGSSSESEKITEWFVSYLSLSLQQDGLGKSFQRLRDEAGALEKSLKALSPVFMDSDKDWQQTAREAAESEQLASQKIEELSEKMVQARSSLESATQAAFNRRIISGVLLVIAAVPLAAKYFSLLPDISPIYTFGFGILFLASAGIMIRYASKSVQTRNDAKDAVYRLEAELQNLREEGSFKRRELNNVIADAKFDSLDDFLFAAKQSEKDRLKLFNIHSRLEEAEQQNSQLKVQSDEIYELLNEGLAKVGLTCSPGNLKYQIDQLRSNLRRFRELDAHYAGCREKADSLKTTESALLKDLDEKDEQIRTLLQQAGVRSPEEFRQECAKTQKLHELTEKAASRSREFERLAGNQTLDQWKERLQELRAQQSPQAYGDKPEELAQKDDLENTEPYLPYLPTIAEAEERQKRISARLSEAREEYARFVERIRNAFETIRPTFKIEEDLAIAERDFSELETNRQAVELAFETLESLSRQQQEVLAPQLNSAVEQRFLRLCRNRYEEVKIDPDFQIWVREMRTGELRSAEHLSRGTQDQLYFAIRFGVLDLISNEKEPCPCLLDEPFAAYDRPRLEKAFEVLSDEATRRQLLLFTCREDLFDLAQECEAHIIRLEDFEIPKAPQ